MKSQRLNPTGWSAIFVLYLLAALPVIAQEETAATASETSTSLLGLLQQGGSAMYPLGLTALFMFFLIFYCWRETSPGRFTPAGLVDALTQPLRRRDLEETRALCANTNSVLSRSLGNALAKARPQKDDANQEKIEASFMDNIEAGGSTTSTWSPPSRP